MPQTSMTWTTTKPKRVLADLLLARGGGGERTGAFFSLSQPLVRCVSWNLCGGHGKWQQEVTSDLLASFDTTWWKEDTVVGERRE